MARAVPSASNRRGKLGLLAILALGVAWGLIMHSMGWAQSAHYAEVRAIAAGHAEVDRWHWETSDEAWINGHYYSVKAPGIAFLTTPLYLAIKDLGGKEVARDAAAEAARADTPNWTPRPVLPYAHYSYNRALAITTQTRVENGTPVVWLLTLVAAVIPAVLLLLAVRRMADRIEPGFGTAAAITLGVSTILMTFAAEYFSHVIAALAGFLAFLVLFRDRASPRLAAAALAGLLAGLAVTFEYPAGLLGAILFFYALGPAGGRLARGGLYAAGAVVGALPALIFNLWAFGSPLKLGYAEAIAEQGISGHEALGLNGAGFFGITAPKIGNLMDLLTGGRGMLVLTPVIVMAVIGVVLMRRRGQRAEANVILAVAVAYFVYNLGYWQSFGGGTPGPRFLITALPFIAVGLAPAYRRFPAVTLGLAVPSAICMLLATITYPLIGYEGNAEWVRELHAGNIEHTLLTALGVHENWLAILPFVALAGAACVLAVRATPLPRLGSLRPAMIALAAWAIVFTIGPTLAGDPYTPVNHGGAAFQLLVAGVGASLLVLGVRRYQEVREERSGRVASLEPALDSGSIS